MAAIGCRCLRESLAKDYHDFEHLGGVKLVRVSSWFESPDRAASDKVFRS